MQQGRGQGLTDDNDDESERGEACASHIFSCHVPRACEARAESWTPSSVSLHVKRCSPSPTKGCKEGPPQGSPWWS